MHIGLYSRADHLCGVPLIVMETKLKLKLQAPPNTTYRPAWTQIPGTRAQICPYDRHNISNKSHWTTWLCLVKGLNPLWTIGVVVAAVSAASPSSSAAAASSSSFFDWRLDWHLVGDGRHCHLLCWRVVWTTRLEILFDSVLICCIIFYCFLFYKLFELVLRVLFTVVPFAIHSTVHTTKRSDVSFFMIIFKSGMTDAYPVSFLRILGTINVNWYVQNMSCFKSLRDYVCQVSISFNSVCSLMNALAIIKRGYSQKGVCYVFLFFFYYYWLATERPVCGVLSPLTGWQCVRDWPNPVIHLGLSATVFDSSCSPRGRIADWSSRYMT